MSVTIQGMVSVNMAMQWQGGLTGPVFVTVLLVCLCALEYEPEGVLDELEISRMCRFIGSEQLTMHPGKYPRLSKWINRPESASQRNIHCQQDVKAKVNTASCDKRNG